MGTVQVTEISTIAQDYAGGLLKRSKAEESSPSASINGKVSLWKGDITSLEVDAIQNAAKNSLRGGGGIDGAIHRAAGPELLKYCKTLNGCETGSTKISPAFDLPSKHVLHTVGPIYDEDEHEECEEALEGCYRSTLQLAVENDLKTIALCGVSTGIYGYPLREATELALRTTRAFLDENEDKLDRVIFCNFGEKDVRIYRQLAPIYFPPTEEDLKQDEAEEKEGNEPEADSKSDNDHEGHTQESANPEEKVGTDEQTASEQHTQQAGEDETPQVSAASKEPIIEEAVKQGQADSTEEAPSPKRQKL